MEESFVSIIFHRQDGRVWANNAYLNNNEYASIISASGSEIHIVGHNADRTYENGVRLFKEGKWWKYSRGRIIKRNASTIESLSEAVMGIVVHGNRELDWMLANPRQIG